jgi:hypothetical protein
MRRRLTYANVVATLALVFSMSGGALAAKHYLLTSTGEISPKVLKKLKGSTGPQGKEGKEGKEGKAGNNGTNGSEGPRGPSNGYQSYHDAAVSFYAAATIGSLAVPAGSYIVSAKLWVQDAANEEIEATCTLTNNVTGDTDTSVVTVQPLGFEFAGHVVVVLEAASTLGSPGSWFVKCDGTNTAEAVDLKMQAIQVATLSNVHT